MVATVVAALVAAAAAAISYLVYRDQVDPNVIVYASHDTKRPTVILVIIKNIGKGVAKNIRFILSEPIRHAYGMGPGGPPPRAMSDGPLIKGIPMLAPGEERVIIWGQYGGLTAAIQSRTISVSAIFDSDPTGFFPSERRQTDSVLEIASFTSTDASSGDHSKETADQLRRIADALNNSARSRDLLRVEIVPPSSP